MLQRGRPRPPFPRRPGCPRASSRRPRHRGGHRGHRRCRTGARRPGAGGEVGLCTASLLHGAFTGRRNGITGLEGKGESTSGLIPGRTKPSGVGVLPGGCTRSRSARGSSSPRARPRHAAAGAAPAGWTEATPEPPLWALLSCSKGKADREDYWGCNVRAGRRFLSDGPVMMDCNVHRFQLLRPVL